LMFIPEVLKRKKQKLFLDTPHKQNKKTLTQTITKNDISKPKDLDPRGSARNNGRRNRKHEHRGAAPAMPHARERNPRVGQHQEAAAQRRTHHGGANQRE